MSKPPYYSCCQRDVLVKIKAVIESAIYGSRQELPEDLQDEIYEKDESIEGDPNMLPFFEIVDKLRGKIQRMDEQMDQAEEKANSEIKNLKRQINYKESEIDTLKKQLAKLQQKDTHPIYEHYNEIVLKNERLLKDNNQLEYKVKQFEEDYDDLKIEHNKLQLEHLALKENYRLLETEFDKMRITKERLEADISEIKDEFELSLQNYQNSLVLLKNSQDIRKKLQKQLEELLEENRRLGNRAAVGFENLTPRFDDFKKTFKRLKIKPPEKERGNTRISSNQYIEKLISTFTKTKEEEDSNKTK